MCELGGDVRGGGGDLPWDCGRLVGIGGSNFWEKVSCNLNVSGDYEVQLRLVGGFAYVAGRQGWREVGLFFSLSPWHPSSSSGWCQFHQRKI